KGESSRAAEAQTDLEFIDGIARSLDLRRFQQTNNMIDGALEEYSWSEMAFLLQGVPVLKADEVYWSRWKLYSRPGVLPVRVGKIRDGLLSLFGLDCVNGIDVDLLKEFRRFKAGDLEELRTKVSDKVMRLLNSQIGGGNTFFLDTNQMRGTPYESLVPIIEDHRAQEFIALEDRPTPRDVMRTYYGYTCLTNSLTNEDRVVLRQLRDPIELTGKRPSYQRSMFPDCSKGLIHLLLNNLRLTFARPQTQVRGAEALGEIADSRALGPLHASLKKKTPNLFWYADPLNRVKYAAIWALGEIGHPSSLVHLRPFVGDFTFDRNALWAISNISHPVALEVLLERAFNEPPKRITCGTFPGRNTSEKDLLSRSYAVDLLWRFQGVRTVKELIRLMQDQYRSVSGGALHALVRTGQVSHQAIRDNFDLVRETLGKTFWPERVVNDLFVAGPCFVETDEGVELLLEHIDRSPDTLSAFRLRPELLEGEQLRIGLLKALSKSTDPLDLIHAMRGVGLLGVREFEDAARGRLPDIAGHLRKSYPQYLFMEALSEMPLLYESEIIHDTLAEVIRTGRKLEYVMKFINGHSTLGHLPVIHDAVMDLLSSGDWDDKCFETILECESVMRNGRVRAVVAKALAKFWSVKENIRASTTWTSRSRVCKEVWVEHLDTLKRYPDMGRITEFQEAVAGLLRLSFIRDCPLDLLGLDVFDELLESDPVRRETEQIVTEQAEDVSDGECLERA
ncbi:MAG: hypothetical protein E3J86_03120, partial [Candidatus Thorarchaeota archaeon]